MTSRLTNTSMVSGGQRGGGGGINRLSSPPSGITESTNQSIKSSIIDEHNPFLSSSFPIDTPPPFRPPNPSPPSQSGDIDEDIRRFEGESMQGTLRSKHIGKQSMPIEEISSSASSAQRSASLSSSALPSSSISTPAEEESGKSRLRSFSDDTIDRLKSIIYSPHTSTILGNSRLMASKTYSMTKNAAGIIATHPMTQSHLLSAKKMINDYKQSVSIYYQLLTGWVLFTHVLWPLLYFWSAYEARVVIFCSFLHFLISHLLYYQYQRLTCTTITMPALLWVLPALFLFMRPGVGEEFAVELAFALHNAHVSPRHVLGLHEVFSSRWYSFLLWYRIALITTSALLPFAVIHNIYDYSYHIEDLQNINNGLRVDEDQRSSSSAEEEYTSTPATSAASAEASEYFEPNQSELLKHQRKPTVSVTSIRAPFQSPLAAPANRSSKEKQFFSDIPPKEQLSNEMKQENPLKNEQEKSGSGTELAESNAGGADRQPKKEMIDQSSTGEKPSGTVGLKTNKPSDTMKDSSNIGAQQGNATAIKKEDPSTEKMAGPAPSIHSGKTN